MEKLLSVSEGVTALGLKLQLMGRDGSDTGGDSQSLRSHKSSRITGLVMGFAF